MERTIRFPAADWRDGDKLNKDRLAAAIAKVLTKTLSAKSSSSAWSSQHRQAEIDVQAPERRSIPALDLTDTIEVTALVAADRPGASDRLMLWISNPVIIDGGRDRRPELNLTDESTGDEETDPSDDNGSVDALAREFRASAGTWTSPPGNKARSPAETGDPEIGAAMLAMVSLLRTFGACRFEDGRRRYATVGRRRSTSSRRSAIALRSPERCRSRHRWNSPSNSA